MQTDYYVQIYIYTDNRIRNIKFQNSADCVALNIFKQPPVRTLVLIVITVQLARFPASHDTVPETHRRGTHRHTRCRKSYNPTTPSALSKLL